jgi:hypothetical protein
LIEESGLQVHHFDSQSFLSSTRDMESFEFSALDTLPHGLSRNAQAAHGLVHRDIIRWSIVDETGAEFVCESNAPWRAGRELFSNDGAVIEGEVDGRWRNAERSGGLPHRHQLAFGWFGRWPEAWDFPVTAQVADIVGVEAMAVSAGAALPVQDARDDWVWIVGGKPPHERNRILVGLHDGWSQTALPSQALSSVDEFSGPSNI